MEYAFKMFNKDLTCTRGRGSFQYEEGIWYEEKEANCVKNGFHCAKNPLDCLSYYPDWDSSVCYVVEIGGDIDEDGYDSKISCTKIRLVRRLTLRQFVSQACMYILEHPEMPENDIVRAGEATPGRNHFCISRGSSARAKGKMGDVLGIIEEAEGEIQAAGVFEIDGSKYLPDIWYNAEGRPADAQE